LPDDEWFEEIDEWQWLWMYQSWIEDLKEKHEFCHDYSTFLGSFTNPDMARKIWESKNPTHYSSEEEFDESTKHVMEVSRQIKEQEKRKVKRRRKKKVIK